MTEPETITTIASAVRRGDRTAADVVDACLDRIGGLDARLNSFRELDAEHARAAAAGIDRMVADGEDPGPLAGVPVGLKDNIVTSFGTTTCGSRILEGFASPYDATAVRRLEAAGAVIVGKTNCDEFAMGSSTEHSAYGPTRNPWDVSRVPGGSSGGSAAAVAAGLCPVALGSDTGGSIRQPAALCGVVGVKPTYGRVSRYGLVAFGSSLDQIGPLTTNVADAALTTSVLAGSDPHDATSVDLDVPDYAADLDTPPADLKLGVIRNLPENETDPAVAEAITRAVGVYRGQGIEIVDIDLALIPASIATYYVIAPAEASSNLARYDGIRYGHRADLAAGEDLFDLYAKTRAEGFGPEVQRRVMLGTYMLSAGYYDAYYKRALQVRRLIKQDLDRAFARCHAIIGPTSPCPAFPLGAKADPLTMYLCDIYTTYANIAGCCAISVPCGTVEGDGGRRLPVGLQIQCPAFAEPTMFQVARLFETNTDHHRLRPPLLEESSP